jgi:elongator complex protein 5
VYHTDVPIDNSSTPYSPSPLSLLSYLATTIMTLHSLPVLLAGKAAQERSLAAPVFGLVEEAEGVVVGLKPLAKTLRPGERGLVIELEHRRKSGRGVHEWYFLPASSELSAATPQTFKETVTLLDDHPLFRRNEEASTEEELAGMTFELGLTDRQRQEREGVVLPYFDAQKGGGNGEGGRILYDMGAEDDFDEEEDEI